MYSASFVLDGASCPKLNHCKQIGFLYTMAQASLYLELDRGTSSKEAV
jgi:hypothetical protein